MSDDLDQKQIQAGDEKGESEKKEKQSEGEITPIKASAESRPIASLPNPVNNTPDSEKKIKPPEPHPANWCEKWTLWLEVAGVLGLVFYCWINWREWQTFDSERVTMQQEFLAGQTNVAKQLAQSQRQIDDSESQQRAILRFGEFRFKKTNVGTNFLGYKRISLEWSYDIKNIGFTPAIDLLGNSFSMWEGGAENTFDNMQNTNFMKKWDYSTIPTPNPLNSTNAFYALNSSVWIMPQQTITNGVNFLTTELMPGTEDFYCEIWISYRDIFQHSWIIGHGGHYTLTNDTFTTDFIYSGKYRDTNQTN